MDSEGAFDPTIGKIIRLWDIGGENAGIPAQEELDKLLKETGYEKLELDGNKVTLKDGATLDLGAAGKGIGCDLVMDLLKNEKEVSGMILNLGGSSVMAYGEKPDQSDWRVAVKDPRDPEGEYLGAITLKGENFFPPQAIMKDTLWRMEKISPHSGSGNRLSGVEWADSSDRSLRQRNYGRRSFHCLLCAGKRKSPSSSGKIRGRCAFCR